jgi:hypothetical protein
MRYIKPDSCVSEHIRNEILLVLAALSGKRMQEETGNAQYVLERIEEMDKYLPAGP